jgi:hypothetical protein
MGIISEYSKFLGVLEDDINLNDGKYKVIHEVGGGYLALKQSEMNIENYYPEVRFISVKQYKDAVGKKVA